MSWDKGFNFRDSIGYVTDGTNETYVRDTGDVYPVTRNAVTFGWNSNLGGADRNSAIDRRLAGLNYSSPGTSFTFQVDLTAPGTYDISLALGDATFTGNHI